MGLGMKVCICIKHSSFILHPIIWVPFQARAKHGYTNTVVGGCATGGAISTKGNPVFSFIFCQFILMRHVHIQTWKPYTLNSVKMHFEKFFRLEIFVVALDTLFMLIIRRMLLSKKASSCIASNAWHQRVHCTSLSL